jgi:hypothetical protein
MKRFLLVATLSTFAFGCGTRAMVPRVTTAKAEVDEKVALELPDADDYPALTRARQIGDYVVYRFTGSYREAPVEVTHTVVDRDDEILVVDVNIEDRGAQERLRMRIAEDGDIISVARWEGNVLRPFGIHAFENLMSQLTLAADENLGLIAEGKDRLDVAGEPVDATISRYRVRVGAHDAVLVTASAPGYRWGDVGGEIRTDAGKVLYKAEIVEAGRVTENGIAAQEEGDVYEGYDYLDSL